MNHSNDLTDFVGGMAWHDIAKPLFLGGDQHSLIGYTLFGLLDGREAEARASLSHHGAVLERNLQVYFHENTSCNALPFWVLLTGPIDQMASTVYGFLPDDPKPDPLKSLQNPFSRLVARNAYTGEKLKAGEVSGGDSRLAKEFCQRLGVSRPWPDIYDSLHDPLARDGGYGTSDIIALLNGFRADFKGKAGLQEESERLFAAYSERTYPPPNDTSLRQHCRFSAALAYVLFRNLETSNSQLLGKKITLSPGRILVNQEPLGLWIGDPNQEWTKIQRVVGENLSCWMVRVSFSGHQKRVNSATRPDDLHGTHHLLDGLRKEFKRFLADRLDVSELADLLPVSESLYDLFYVLPARFYPEKSGIEHDVQQAYQRTVQSLVGEQGKAMSELIRDFGDFTELQVRSKGDQLAQELGMIPLSVATGKVEVEPNHVRFGEFKLEFSEKFLAVFEELAGAKLPLDQARTLVGPESEMPVDTLQKLVSEVLQQPFPGEVCEVCNTNPEWLELSQLADAAEKSRQEAINKVLRAFRGEREKLCLSCAAIRAMSHARVKVEALRKIVIWNRDEGKVRLRPSPDNFPDIPPLARLSAPLDEVRNRYADLGIAYVRPSTSRQLDIFPTISYAADANSNVALVDLRPNVATLVAEHGMSEVLDWDLPQALLQLKPWNVGPLRQLEDRLVAFHNLVKEWIQRVVTVKAGRGRWLKRQIDDAENTNQAFSDVQGFWQANAVAIGTIAHWIGLDIGDLDACVRALHDFRKHPFRREGRDAICSHLNELNQKLKTGIMCLQALAVHPDFGRVIEHKDLEELSRYLVEAHNKADGAYRDELEVVRGHVARVLHRINWINRFFAGLQEALQGGGIRILPLETPKADENRYQRCLLAVPADRLPAALGIIYNTMLRDLFSSSVEQPVGKATTSALKLSVELFRRVLPPLLYGSVVVFKVKQPLYVALALSDDLIERLRTEYEQEWYGALLGFCDARGTITERAALQATCRFDQVPDALDLAYGLDRASLIPAAVVDQRYPDPEAETFRRQVKQTLLSLRGKRQGWPKEYVGLLEDDELFDAVLFLLFMARR